MISDVMNEKSPLVLQIYDRSIEEECFLGLAELRPKLVNNHTIDQWFPLQARPGEDHAVTGEIRIQIRYEKYDVRSLSSHSPSDAGLNSRVRCEAYRSRGDCRSTISTSFA